VKKFFVLNIVERRAPVRQVGEIHVFAEQALGVPDRCGSEMLRSFGAPILLCFRDCPKRQRTAAVQDASRLAKASFVRGESRIWFQRPLKMQTDETPVLRLNRIHRSPASAFSTTLGRDD
jgi:hypothetical protein